MKNKMKIDKSKHDSEPDKKPKKIKKWAKELISILLIVSLFSFALDYYYSANMPSGSAPHIVGTGLNGEILDVKVIGKDPKNGKLKISRKVLLPKPEKKQEAKA